jgi:hypothetical protein
MPSSLRASRLHPQVQPGLPWCGGVLQVGARLRQFGFRAAVRQDALYGSDSVERRR